MWFCRLCTTVVICRWWFKIRLFNRLKLWFWFFLGQVSRIVYCWKVIVGFNALLDSLCLISESDVYYLYTNNPYLVCDWHSIGRRLAVNQSASRRGVVSNTAIWYAIRLWDKGKARAVTYLTIRSRICWLICQHVRNTQLRMQCPRSSDI